MVALSVFRLDVREIFFVSVLVAMLVFLYVVKVLLRHIEPMPRSDTESG